MKQFYFFLLLIFFQSTLKGHINENFENNSRNYITVTIYTNQCYYSNLLTGVTIQMVSTEAPFNIYTEVSDENGIALFDSVAEGTYDITADKPGYKSETYFSQHVQQGYTATFQLPKKAYPVRNLYVDPKTSIATWDPPLISPLVITNFEELSFPPISTGDWSLDSDGEGWYKSSTDDSLFTNWQIPEWPDHYAVVNHDYSSQGGTYDFLITPELDLRESDDFVLYFDSYFDSFYGGVATVEYSVDNGVTWNLLEQLEPDTVWKKQSVDLSALSGEEGLKNVKIAFYFTAGSGPLYDGWAVDNVEIYSNDTAHVTEYNLMLYNVTGDIILPPGATSYCFNDLVYGETYMMRMFTKNDCGASANVSYQWQSAYLYPPRNVRDEYVYNTAVVPLLWDLPAKGNEGTVYGINNKENMYSSFKPDNTTVLTPIVAYTAGNFVDAGEFKIGTDDTMYFVDNAGMVDEVKVDDSVVVTSLGNCGLSGVTGMALDYSTGIYYLSLGNGDLYTIDFSDLSTSFVGSTSINNLIGITFAGDSSLYGCNKGENTFYMIDKETAAATVIGDIGLSAGYGQGLGYDHLNDMVVMSVYNDGTGQAEYRSVDLTTGISSFIGVIGPAGTQFGTIAMPSPDAQTVPDGLLSFNVYRNGNLMVNIPYEGEQPPYQPEFDDFTVQPGTYIYKVSALYDLTRFGYPGNIGESCFGNEDTVVVIWGKSLPFTEEWNSGNFEANQWMSDTPNWVINNSTGDGAPSAEFKNMPNWENGYESSLISSPFRVDSLSEGSFWLDFNLKLDDLNQTGEERLTIEVFDGNGWHQVGEVANNGSFDFEEGFNHIEITRYIKDNTFRVRFKATGQNSSHIQSWYVDNINIYRTCDPPKNLEGAYVWKQGGNYGVQLCWEAPDYPYFNSDWIYWDNGQNFTAVAACLGFSAAIRWDAGMLDQYNGDYLTAVNFYTLSLGYDSLVLKVWKDTSASELVYRQNVSSDLKENSWNMIWLNTPVEIESDKELWVGYTIYGAVAGIFTAGSDKGPAITGYGDKISEGGTWDNLSDLGLNYNWNIQALVEPLSYQPEPLPLQEDDTVSCSYRSTPVLGNINQNGETASASFNRDLEGFRVYRSETGEEGTYVEYATVPYVAARDKYCYFDHEPNVQPQTSYWYKVSALRNSETDGCESPFANSKLMPDEDFVTVFITDVEEFKKEETAVYPNPADNLLNIISSETITRITVYNYSGKAVFNQTINKQNKFVLNTATFHAGVYIAKIKTGTQEVFKRFVVVR